MAPRLGTKSAFKIQAQRTEFLASHPEGTRPAASQVRNVDALFGLRRSKPDRSQIETRLHLDRSRGEAHTCTTSIKNRTPERSLNSSGAALTLICATRRSDWHCAICHEQSSFVFITVMAGINDNLIDWRHCGITYNCEHDTNAHLANLASYGHGLCRIRREKRRGKRKIRSNAPKDLLTLLERTIILPLATTKRLDA